MAPLSLLVALLLPLVGPSDPGAGRTRRGIPVLADAAENATRAQVGFSFFIGDAPLSEVHRTALLGGTTTRGDLYAAIQNAGGTVDLTVRDHTATLLFDVPAKSAGTAWLTVHQVLSAPDALILTPQAGAAPAPGPASAARVPAAPLAPSLASRLSAGNVVLLTAGPESPARALRLAARMVGARLSAPPAPRPLTAMNEAAAAAAFATVIQSGCPATPMQLQWRIEAARTAALNDDNATRLRRAASGFLRTGASKWRSRLDAALAALTPETVQQQCQLQGRSVVSAQPVAAVVLPATTAHPLAAAHRRTRSGPQLTTWAAYPRGDVPPERLLIVAAAFATHPRGPGAALRALGGTLRARATPDGIVIRATCHADYAPRCWAALAPPDPLTDADVPAAQAAFLVEKRRAEHRAAAEAHRWVYGPDAPAVRFMANDIAVHRLDAAAIQALAAKLGAPVFIAFGPPDAFGAPGANPAAPAPAAATRPVASALAPAVRGRTTAAVRQRFAPLPPSLHHDAAARSLWLAAVETALGTAPTLHATRSASVVELNEAAPRTNAALDQALRVAADGLKTRRNQRRVEQRAAALTPRAGRETGEQLADAVLSTPASPAEGGQKAMPPQARWLFIRSALSGDAFVERTP